MKYGIIEYITTTIVIVYFSMVYNMEAFAQNMNGVLVHEITKDLFEIKMDNISFVVKRDGGKIISFKYGDTEILAPRNIHNMYGSTLWPDPQSSWNWPPPPVLDENPYEGGIKENSIDLISEKDKSTGWQFQKIFSPSAVDTSISIVYRIKNISNKPKSVGAWEITRVPVGGLTFFKQGKPADLPASDLNNISIDDGIVWYQPDNTPFPEGRKFFSTEAGGWLAHIYKNLLFIKKFPTIDLKYLAKGQGPIEIYGKGDKSYIEIENHGEHKELLPGQVLEYTVKWYLRMLPADMEASPKNKILPAIVSDIVKN